MNIGDFEKNCLKTGRRKVPIKESLQQTVNARTDSFSKNNASFRLKFPSSQTNVRNSPNSSSPIISLERQNKYLSNLNSARDLIQRHCQKLSPTRKSNLHSVLNIRQVPSIQKVPNGFLTTRNRHQ